MLTINNYVYENCTKKCKNPEHGDRINSVLIKESIGDEKVAAYIAKTCKNFARVLDHQGQSALHVAASLHKYAIVEWLINNNAEINLADKQNGHTPLHRAIRSGHFDIAILLLSYGASFEVNDRKSKSSVQYCCKPKNYVDAHSNIKEKNHSKEILVWGNNRNYNLGLENKEGKPYPHHLDIFQKQNITIRNVSISRYHCLYVDDKGELYAVGLGDGGRLGAANETTLVLPKKIHLTNRHKNECVVGISAGRNHSIILTSEDRIFTCGLNTYGQIGQPNYGDKSLIFREIEIDDKGFRGVFARDYHSLAYTSDSIYACGLNVGQFGLSAVDDKLIEPKKLTTYSHSIAMVDSSDAAIVCVTTSGQILLYAKFKVKTIRKPIVHETIKDIAVTGGEPINTAISIKSPAPAEPLEILVLTSSDVIFLWSNDTQKYLRCYMRHSIPLQKIYWSGKNVLCLSSDGYLYLGHLTKQSIDLAAVHESTEEFVEQKSNRRLDICEQTRCEITTERIPNIDRVTDVSVDQCGESFVILQENSKRYLTMPVLPDDPITFKSLLTETTDFDSFHDVVFHVEDDVFPAHKFIIFSRAEGLRDIVKKSTDKHIYLNFEGLTSKMFELILKYIYENHALTMTDIEDVEASFDPFSGLSNLEIYTLFREYMGKFGVAKFFDRLMGAQKDREPSMRLNRLSYPELYDVTIKCADQMEIKAHRCVLSTRLEYFNMMMFNSNWAEATREVINLTTVQKEYMEPIINFLYNNDAHLIRKQHYTETFSYHLMEICDRFFVNHLKNIIEVIMIEKMTARKCGDMLEFAEMFNCDLLEAAALEYICQNMGRLLENRCLDHLQVETLTKISTHYHEMYQFTTAASDHLIASLMTNVVSDESIFDFTEDFQIDLHVKCDTHAERTSTMLKSKKTERPTSDRRNYEKEGINLMKNLSIESNAKKPSISIDDSIISEAEEISKSISAEMAKWTKVADKKDVKKKIILAGLKTNAILKTETKERDDFKPLNSTSLASDIESDLDQSFNSTGANTSIDSISERTLQFHLSLGDFTPQKAGKVSQKQRKRQLSQTESIDQYRPQHVTSGWTQQSSHTPKQTIDMPNAWKMNVPILETRPTTSTPLKSHSTQPIAIASSGTSTNSAINESFFSSSPSTSARAHTKSPRSVNGSFSRILDDERKQKEYFIKLKSKSLLLTQMEEAAIVELKKFYNVENVFDELIEIERKCFVSPTLNFTEWKHQ